MSNTSLFVSQVSFVNLLIGNWQETHQEVNSGYVWMVELQVILLSEFCLFVFSKLSVVNMCYFFNERRQTPVENLQGEVD